MTGSSIVLRLTVPILLAVLGLGAAYTWFWEVKYERVAEQNFLNNGQQTTSLLAAASVNPVWDLDADSARHILYGFKSKDSFVHAATFEGDRVFALYGRDELSVSFDSLGRARFATGGPLHEYGLVYFAAPIVHASRGVIGHLVAAFDVTALNDQRQAARREAMLAAAVAFGVLATMLIVLALSVTRPLVRITATIESVAAGELASEIPDKDRRDEVGRLARALEVFRRRSTDLIDAKAQAAANRRVAKLALIDDLTGLPNRRAIQEHFTMIDEQREGTCAGEFFVLQIDLDGFKQINDTVGHEAGDKVICATADRLKSIETEGDLAARIGGDEFVLILDCSRPGDDAVETANRIISDVQQPVQYEARPLRVGASVGIAKFDPGEDKMSDALRNADIALYRAKAQGKGCAVEYSDAHKHEILALQQTSDDISRGLERNEFVPYFQPIIDSGTMRIVSVEMLARWRHPVEGILPPIRFLGVAEELRLLSTIDRQVFSSAIRGFETLRAADVEPPRLSINVSGARLMQQDFFRMLQSAQNAQVEVDVELLESTYLDELSEEMDWRLDQIRSLGAGIHIDDFGTGHSSIAGLIRIAPDKLKIDRQFVIPALESDQARDLVKIILGIADLLNIEVVAEGIETVAHADAMRELGCRYLQGYALGKPMPLPDLLELLKLNNGNAALSA